MCVMSEVSKDMNIGPDLFQFYVRGISELLAGDDFVPSAVETSRLVGAGSGSFKDKEFRAGSSSLYSNATGDGLLSHEKARLMAMLRQSVIALNQEADEMLDPVISMIRLRALMAPTPTKSCVRYQDANGKDGTESHARKRLKVSVDDEPLNISSLSCNLSREGSPKERKSVAEPCKSLTRCNNRGCVKSMQKTNPDEHKVNDDLQILLVNKPKVVKKMEKHSAELSVTLGRMKDKLEELLDIVISSCRPMTLAEKHHLRRLIEKLPPRNLDRVVEIIQRGKPPEKHSSHDIAVELQHEDDVTLWRIYFYVKAVENAVKLL